jgi:hypothetical protein
MRTVTERAPTRVAYCEPYAAPWSHDCPPGAKVSLILDDGPHVARIELDGAVYLLTRRGDQVQP